MQSLTLLLTLAPLALAIPQQIPQSQAQSYTQCNGAAVGSGPALFSCIQAAAGYNAAAAGYLATEMGGEFSALTVQNTGPSAIPALAAAIAALPTGTGKDSAQSVLNQIASLQGVALPAQTGATSGGMPSSGMASPTGGAGTTGTNGTAPAGSGSPSGSASGSAAGPSGSAGASGVSSANAAPVQTNMVIAAGVVAGIAGLAVGL